MCLPDPIELMEAREDRLAYEWDEAQKVFWPEMRGAVFVRSYCNDPAAAWPIIVENGIGTYKYKNSNNWNSHFNARSGIENCHTDKNPLRAAMICYLKMKESDDE